MKNNADMDISAGGNLIQFIINNQCERTCFSGNKRNIWKKLKKKILILESLDKFVIKKNWIKFRENQSNNNKKQIIID